MTLFGRQTNKANARPTAGTLHSRDEEASASEARTTFPNDMGDPTHAADSKKRPLSPQPSIYEEAADMDMSDKKRRTLPPRFSSIFDYKPPSSPSPPPPTHPPVVECCHRSHQPGGVRLPKLVFVALVAILLFESALLFVYTLLGIYRTLPLAVPAFGAASASTLCQGDARVPNVAPEIYLGGANPAHTQAAAAAFFSESRPSPIANGAASVAPSDPTAAARALLGLAPDPQPSSSPSPSPPVVVVTQAPDVVTSVVAVSPTSASTVTSVKVVDGPVVTQNA